MAELIKAYPTRGLADRTPENYWNAFRNYLLADEDVSAKFDISEFYDVVPAAGSTGAAVGFKMSPKNIGNSTSFCICGYENGNNCGLREVYFGDTKYGNIGGNGSSSANYSIDLPLILIKDEGLILFAVDTMRDALMFVDMTNTYSGQTINHMIAFAKSASFVGAPTGTASSSINAYFSRTNIYEHYLLYPFILNGFTHKSLYVYDGGETQLAVGNWMIDNKKYANLGYAVSGRGNQILICLEENSGGGSGDAVLGTKEITENGIYNAADDELDGYSAVKVSVPTSAPEIRRGEYDLSRYGRVTSGSDILCSITFDEPMPSGNYAIEVSLSGHDGNINNYVHPLGIGWRKTEQFFCNLRVTSTITLEYGDVLKYTAVSMGE